MPQHDPPTPATKKKVDAAKAYIENLYKNQADALRRRVERRAAVEHEARASSMPAETKEELLSELERREREFTRLKRAKLTAEDFEPLTIIGRGAFGEVRLVRDKSNGCVYAMKKLKKTEMVRRGQVDHVKAERNLLAEVHDEAVVKLFYSFQDEEYLYLVMEYLPGGDMMTLLMRRDTLTEEETRFYIAQTILALETVHAANFIHRDIKPDNLLLDRDGHMKLSDFGLCKPVDGEILRSLPSVAEEDLEEETNGANVADGGEGEDAATKRARQLRNWHQNRRRLAYSTVGTPDYIAPEVCSRKGTGWRRLLVRGRHHVRDAGGVPPFYSDEPMTTCRKIVHWRHHLRFPNEVPLSLDARDLIERLLCGVDNRLGSNGGAGEIKHHPFFQGLDWDSLYRVKAPYTPDVEEGAGHASFEHFDEEKKEQHLGRASREAGGDDPARKEKKDLDFVGYTYKNFEVVGNGTSVRKKAARQRPSRASIFPGAGGGGGRAVTRTPPALAGLAGLSVGDRRGTPEFHTARGDFQNA